MIEVESVEVYLEAFETVELIDHLSANHRRVPGRSTNQIKVQHKKNMEKHRTALGNILSITSLLLRWPSRTVL